MSKHTTEANIPAQLLREAVAQISGRRSLVYGAEAGLLAAIAQRVDHVLVLARVAAQAHARSTLVLQNIAWRNDVVSPLAPFASYDMAVIEAPQSRSLARRWLVETHGALREGGALYLGGLNDGGIRPMIDDAAALFGNAHTLVSKQRGRVARMLKQHAPLPPAWASEPGIAPGTWHSFDVELSDGMRRIESLPGVFAYDRLDAATHLLLEHLGDATGARVLDIGCGYGIIGVVLAQRGAAQVDMFDENLYAVAAAKRNAATLGLPNTEVAAADVRAAPFRGPYDLVATNPPFHQGKQIEYNTPHAFIAYARSVLAPNGQLVLVANSFIRYEAVMREHFGNVKAIARTPSFTLWQAKGE